MLPLLETGGHGIELDQSRMLQSLATGRLDPFARFPIEDTTGTHELVDYCKLATCPAILEFSSVNFSRT
jgi:hypothetical protein